MWVEAFHPSPPNVVEPALYDFTANDQGIRISPRSPEGHALVMDLLTRLGFEQSYASATTRPRTDADVLREVFGDAPSPAPVVPEVAAQPAPIDPTPQPADPVVADHPPGRRSLLLSELAAIHLADLARGRKKATPATRDRTYVLQMLINVLGDLPVSDITPAHVDDLAAVLAGWPKHAQNHPQLRDLSPSQIVAYAKRHRLPVIQRSTQRKHLMGLIAFFTAAQNAGEITESPFRFMKTSRYNDGASHKEVFTAQDLQQVFDPKHLMRYTEPHKYWAPLIALFSSMRVNEVAQLFVEDIETDTVLDDDGRQHDVMFFNISDRRACQSVKSDHSRRLIPVHSRLLALGFAQYVADVRASGSEHLFPGLAWREGGPGRVVSRWFNGRHLRKTCGITSSAKSLHSLRHTVTTKADRAHVPDSIIRTINGHSPGEGVDRQTYVARGTLLECQRALESLNYPPLDLVPYQSERFRDYLRHAVAQDAQADRLRAEGKPVIRKKGRPFTRQFPADPATHTAPDANCLGIGS